MKNELERNIKNLIIGENSYSLGVNSAMRAVELELSRIRPSTQKDAIHISNAKHHLQQLKRQVKLELQKNKEEEYVSNIPPEEEIVNAE